MSTERPVFRKAKTSVSYSSPEELFNKLPNRAQSHGYLRQPQADVLREYQKQVRNVDMALELPTGTGKTAVGLLIAEWKRRQTGGQAAFLTVTNQLARQVMREAERLGIEYADLTGTKDTRDPAAVGRYKTGNAVAISTYANLFNVKPVIQASEILVFDDAHGGEQVAAEMWTVRVSASRHGSVYEEALTALRPALTDTQYRLITGQEAYGSVELADVVGHPEIKDQLISLLNAANDRDIRFPWSLVGTHLDACLVLVSHREIVVRPLVPPTHTHSPFADAKQRIYMSATLGGQGDLQRGYGITKLTTIRAEHAQWGKRYVFMPELYLEEDEAWATVSAVCDQASPRRAVLLAPSGPVADASFERLSDAMSPAPKRIGKEDIEESMEPFVESDGSVLCLAGRYDGIDLPGDDCRILVIAETPAAVNPLERHLREHWKLGPILRLRERTRLIQGMGRCTRDATDYAVIFLMGRSLIDSVTSSSMMKLLPGEIQREIRWGQEQGQSSKEDARSIEKMAIGLLEDSQYRKDANESIEELDTPNETGEALSKEQFGSMEVEFSFALWSSDLTRAFEVAKQASDTAGGPELTGYRAWWLYLAAVTAAMQGDRAAQVDCLERARATGVNAGYLDSMLRANSADAPGDIEDDLDLAAEAVWKLIETWGWQGPTFARNLDEMSLQLSKWTDSTAFHMGLECLGKCVGAETLRPTDDGAPDVVWVFEKRGYTFEAKASKKLSKKYVLQAKAHPNWVISKRPDLRQVRWQSLVVSPSGELEELAVPHAGNLNHISVDEIVTFSQRVAATLKKVRTKYVGKEYGDALPQLKVDLRSAAIDWLSVDKIFSSPLIK